MFNQPARRGHLYIQERQDALGLSDVQLARRLGETAETVFRWKREQWRITPAIMEKLAGQFGCRPNDLFRRP
jgi:transcriptional regulator with XRE-family HTH domain